MSLDYLVIGHLTADQVGDARDGADAARVGGTAYYAARTARLLGRGVAVVTAAGADLPGHDLEALGVVVHARPSARSTAFSNAYAPGGARTQRVGARAAPILAGDVPATLRGARAVHLAPVLGECAPDLLAQHRGAGLRAATLQGWLRRVDAAGDVVPHAPAGLADALAGLDVAIFSEEDVAGLDGVTGAVARRVGLVAVTRGACGAVLYRQGVAAPVAPGRVYDRRDTTGAGDVFAAALIGLLADGCPPARAAARACAVASEFVGHGFAGVAAARTGGAFGAGWETETPPP